MRKNRILHLATLSSWEPILATREMEYPILRIGGWRLHDVEEVRILSRSGSLSASKYAGGRPNLFGLPILDGSASVDLYTRLSCCCEQDRVLVPASSAVVVLNESERAAPSGSLKLAQCILVGIERIQLWFREWGGWPLRRK